MLFSIIIPLYNKAPYIQYTIQSVLNQTYQNFEIIIIDDGSSDCGPSLVSEFADPRIRLIAQKNGGVARARNHGVSLAQGDMVCFLDADDWYLPEYIETLANMAAEHPDHRVYATMFCSISESPPRKLSCGVKNIEAREIIGNIFSRSIGRDPIFCICSTSVRRKYLQSLQPCFPEGEQMGEDLDLLFRLACSNPIVWCSAPLVGYRTEVAASLCTTNPVVTVLPVFHRLEMRARGTGIPLMTRYSMLALAADTRITIARRTLVAGEWRNAVKELVNARYGIFRHRWWITLMMCLCPIPDLTIRWHRWRDSSGRKQ